MRTLLRAALAASLLAAAASPAAAFSVCGVRDGGPGDLEPRRGVVAVSCALERGAFVGSVTDLATRKSHRLLISGSLLGQGAITVRTAYRGGHWRGAGSEGAFLLGRRRGGGASGVSLVASATTFSAGDATASASGDEATAAALDSNAGVFEGPGVLSGALSWNAGAGAIELTGSQVGVYRPDPPRAALVGEPGWDNGSIGGPRRPVAPIPEPGTWALLILGFGLMGTVLRRRSRAAP